MMGKLTALWKGFLPTQRKVLGALASRMVYLALFCAVCTVALALLNKPLALSPGAVSGSFQFSLVDQGSARAITTNLEAAANAEAYVEHPITPPGHTVQISWGQDARWVELGAGDLRMSFTTNQLIRLRGDTVRLSLVQIPSPAYLPLGKNEQSIRVHTGAGSNADTRTPKFEEWTCNLYDGIPGRMHTPGKEEWARLVFPTRAHSIDLHFHDLTLKLHPAELAHWSGKDVVIKIEVTPGAGGV